MRISDWSSDVCSSDLTLYIGMKIIKKGILPGAGNSDDDKRFDAWPHYFFLAQRQAFKLYGLFAFVDQFQLETARRYFPPGRLEGTVRLERQRKRRKRSEEWRVGKEFISTCRSWWSP